MELTQDENSFVKRILIISSHLEATNKISTDCFLAAFTRFSSRRGYPAHIYSGNGTAFVGAANVMKNGQVKFLTELRHKIVSDNIFQSVDWHFIPPGPLHMDGLWEAGVQKCSEIYFWGRIEACLNSRPHCPMTDNPSDINPLKPGHFLVGTWFLNGIPQLS